MTGDNPFDDVVTAETVYRKLEAIGVQVAKVDSKVDRIDDKVSGVVARVDDHEKRIRDLEAARWPHGKLTLLLALAGLLVAVLALIAKEAG